MVGCVFFCNLYCLVEGPDFYDGEDCSAGVSYVSIRPMQYFSEGDGVDGVKGQFSQET